MDHTSILYMNISMELSSLEDSLASCEEAIHFYERSIYNQGNGYNPEELLACCKLLEQIQKMQLVVHQLLKDFDSGKVEDNQLADLEQRVCHQMKSRLNIMESFLKPKFPHIFS